jgi:hypothetical protein
VIATPPVYPWPIGVGARYHPAASNPFVASARPLGELRCGNAATAFRVHVELFGARQVVIVPAGIGVSPRGCAYPASTSTPTGVVRVTRSGITLGDWFRVWGRRLSPSRLLGFAGRVELYVNGRRRSGDPGRLVLRPHDEIVLEVGGYVPPHTTYLFPRGER